NAGGTAKPLPAHFGDGSPKRSLAAGSEPEGQGETGDRKESGAVRTAVKKNCRKGKSADGHHTAPKLCPVANCEAVGNKSAHRHQRAFRQEQYCRVNCAGSRAQTKNFSEVVVHPVEEDVLEIAECPISEGEEHEISVRKKTHPDSVSAFC